MNGRLIVILSLFCFAFASTGRGQEEKETPRPDESEPLGRSFDEADTKRVSDVLDRYVKAGPDERANLAVTIRDLLPAGLPALAERLGGLQDLAVRFELERLIERGVRLLAADLVHGRSQESADARTRLMDLAPYSSLFFSRAPATFQMAGPEKSRPVWKGLKQDFLSRLEGDAPKEPIAVAGHLAAPLLEWGLEAEEAASVRTKIQKLVETILTDRIALLDNPDPDVRRYARESIYGMGEPALNRLKELFDDPDPERRHFARRLHVRIRYSVSEELYRRLGRTLDDYESRPWRERRALCNELWRLGKSAAIPTLRRIVESDPSIEVKALAAEHLARLGDPLGLRVLEEAGLLDRLKPQATAGIYMDQGLKYLGADRYEDALREFNKVLDLQPTNEIALYNIACTYSRMGELQKAIEYLKKSVEHGFDDLEHIEGDPDLDNIRETTGYRELIEKLRQEHER